MKAVGHDKVFPYRDSLNVSVGSYMRYCLTNLLVVVIIIVRNARV